MTMDSRDGSNARFSGLSGSKLAGPSPSAAGPTRRGILLGAGALAGSVVLGGRRASAQAKLGAPNLIKPGTLIMSINPTLPPLQFVNDKGELQGMRVELGNEIAKVLGITPGPVLGRAYTYLLSVRLDEGPIGPDVARERLLAWWAEQPESR